MTALCRILSVRRPTHLRSWLSLLLLMGGPLLAETISTRDLREPQSARTMLDPAAQAEFLREVNLASERMPFSGTYVHQQSQGMHMLRMHHAPSAQGPVTRLESLEGSAKEVVRGPHGLRTYQLDHHVVKVSQQLPGRPDFPKLYVGDPARLLKHYQMAVLPGKRVAGFETDLIELRPTDRLRWPVRCWVQKRNRLMLKMQQLSQAGMVLEEHAFIDLRVGPSAHPVLRSPFEGQPGWREQPAGMQLVAPELKGAASLPAGFTVIAQLISENKLLNQWVISDGLATISVFAERRQAVGNDLSDGQRGSMSSSARQRDEWLVTAMGEVPPETASLLATSFPVPH